MDKSNDTKRVLVAPLDWGLGHATRCVPIIQEFLRRGCHVCIAGSGDSLRLLQREFPDLRAFSLPGYAPKYPRRGSMAFSMARQLPRFLSVIAQERRQLATILARERFDLIVSDNRYGCRSSAVPSVFITHQSNILMPARFGWLAGLVRSMNERLINRFDMCWIPDFPGGVSLAGALSADARPRVNINRMYIGWLSRFSPPAPVGKKWDVLAIFSGPEPQRTLFENIVVPQLLKSGLTFRVVRGLPAATEDTNDDRIVNFLTAADLQEWICSARMVIARSGYSTVMDMQVLGQKAVFVPTPGQTEQEYLADRLMKAGIAFAMSQQAFDVMVAWREHGRFKGFFPAVERDRLRDAIDAALGLTDADINPFDKD